jgi:transglutaminase-like putative cysteine protease
VGATPVVWRAATLIGVPALIGTLVLAALLPTLSLSGFGFGNGPGGNGPLQLTDPSLDLRRNLNQPQNKEVITYQTDAPGGLYLRLASLPQFNAQGWSNVQIRLNSGDQMPQVPGLTNPPGQERTTRISVRDFRSQYLPMPYAPRSFDAAGDWRYDANSLTVVNGENQAESLANLSYTVRSVDVAPDGDALDSAVAGTPLDTAVTSPVPSDLPADLVQLSKQVTENADTPAAKAAAIQAYLRSSRFTYSVEPLPGSGYRALENFLLRDRKGYCEQFATAMAMMARVAGIPSRVSVGFLPGKRDGNTWRVSIRDMHAWPELYFAGYGWLRFEPTPRSDGFTEDPVEHHRVGPAVDARERPGPEQLGLRRPQCGAQPERRSAVQCPVRRPGRADRGPERDGDLPLGQDARGQRRRAGRAGPAGCSRHDPGAAARRAAGR